MKTISWEKENTEQFGLDYSTLHGEFNGFSFDMRYDCDTNGVKPEKCVIWLTIRFNGGKIDEKSSYSLSGLKKYCHKFMKDLQEQFANAKFETL